jgi:hypothetical protein
MKPPQDLAFDVDGARGSRYAICRVVLMGFFAFIALKVAIDFIMFLNLRRYQINSHASSAKL